MYSSDVYSSGKMQLSVDVCMMVVSCLTKSALLMTNL